MLSGTLDPNKLKRDPEAIKKLYQKKNKYVVANDDFYILFPERYINKNLATIGSTVKLISIYAIVSKEMKYAVVNAPVFVNLIVNNITSVLINGVVYKVLEIAKGDTYIPNTNLVRSESFMYDIFDEFFLQGKVPWYIDYESLSNLFTEAGKYAGSKIGNDPLAMEIVASLISRDSKDKKISFRESVKSKVISNKPAYVGLNNVFYSYDNTMSKLMGGYFQQGITTAIVNPEVRTTKASELIRK